MSSFLLDAGVAYEASGGKWGQTGKRLAPRSRFRVTRSFVLELAVCTGSVLVECAERAVDLMVSILRNQTENDVAATDVPFCVGDILTAAKWIRSGTLFAKFEPSKE